MEIGSHDRLEEGMLNHELPNGLSKHAANEENICDKEVRAWPGSNTSTTTMRGLDVFPRHQAGSLSKLGSLQVLNLNRVLGVTKMPALQ